MYPPRIRIGYKGNVEERMKTSMRHLTRQCYNSFLQQLEKYKKTHRAHVHLTNGVREGKILHVNPQKMTLLLGNQKRLEIHLDQVQFIDFI
jgi:hypothetical protein